MSTFKPSGGVNMSQGFRDPDQYWKARENLKQSVQIWAEKWGQRLGLEGWTLDGPRDRGSSEGEAGGCYAEPRYLYAQVDLDHEMLVDYSPSDVEETLVHEFVHPLTWRLREFCEQLIGGVNDPSARKYLRWVLEEMDEELVTRLSKALMRTQDDATDRSV